MASEASHLNPGGWGTPRHGLRRRRQGLRSLQLQGGELFGGLGFIGLRVCLGLGHRV